MCGETGIPFQPEQTAGYIKNWIAVLKDDKNEFFNATHDASAIAEYILALEKGRVSDEPEAPLHVDRLDSNAQPVGSTCHDEPRLEMPSDEQLRAAPRNG